MNSVLRMAESDQKNRFPTKMKSPLRRSKGDLF